MWFLPLIFLTSEGRSRIGIRGTEKPIGFLWSVVFGTLGGAALFLLGWALFGKNADNWYVSILNSLEIDESLYSLRKMELFLLFTVPAVLFSPVGEELFFRGMVHASVAEQWGSRSAPWMNGLAFAGMHLLQHGLSIDGSGVHIRWVSGAMWFSLMVALSGVFTLIRKKAGPSGRASLLMPCSTCP
jgi:hypothetical protein